MKYCAAGRNNLQVDTSIDLKKTVLREKRKNQNGITAQYNLCKLNISIK